MNCYTRLAASGSSAVLFYDEFSIARVLYLCVGSKELEDALCTSLCTVFLFTGEALLFILTREYKKEHLSLFIWFSLSISLLLFKSLFLLEKCAEDAEGPMLILSKKTPVLACGR